MKKNKGFTLVELVIVIVILGIIAAVTVPAYVDIREDAKLSALKATLGTLRAAIALKYAESAVDGSAAAAFPGSITGSMFSDGAVPADPFNNSNEVTTGNPLPTADGTQGSDQPGGWVYNPATGEIRIDNDTYKTY
jgi:prepilin-type N-terminal cleavage/methylation domain-containing protein